LNKLIEIIVNPKGETTVQTKGFTGGSCRDASRLIEQALGENASEQMTAEFHLSAPQTQAEQLSR